MLEERLAEASHRAGPAQNITITAPVVALNHRRRKSDITSVVKPRLSSDSTQMIPLQHCELASAGACGYKVTILIYKTWGKKKILPLKKSHSELD